MEYGDDMQFIKNVIKHTFLYDIFKRIRGKHLLPPWTAHDQEMFVFYSQFVSRGALCFDVGANVGNRVKIFLKMQANVVAIEPQDECVRILRTVYGSNHRLSVVQKALGESDGEAEMMISNPNTISSLSPEWIESVRKSGRFPKSSWDKKQIVPVTTLDRLIEQYGTPSFIKIDVEGFEYQVIKGLSQPVKMLSLEFTPEFIESTFKCFEHLQQLGDIRLNYSVGETMCLALEKWVTHSEMVKILSGLGNDNILFGDVYVQFQN
jgi:FkbM family methyltransferase